MVFRPTDVISCNNRDLLFFFLVVGDLNITCFLLNSWVCDMLAIGIAWVFVNKFVHSNDRNWSQFRASFFACLQPTFLSSLLITPLDASKVMTFRNHLASLATGNEMLLMAWANLFLLLGNMPQCHFFSFSSCTGLEKEGTRREAVAKSLFLYSCAFLFFCSHCSSILMALLAYRLFASPIDLHFFFFFFWCNSISPAALHTCIAKCWIEICQKWGVGFHSLTIEAIGLVLKVPRAT